MLTWYISWVIKNIPLAIKEKVTSSLNISFKFRPAVETIIGLSNLKNGMFNILYCHHWTGEEYGIINCPNESSHFYQKQITSD